MNHISNGFADNSQITLEELKGKVHSSMPPEQQHNNMAENSDLTNSVQTPHFETKAVVTGTNDAEKEDGAEVYNSVVN